VKWSGNCLPYRSPVPDTVLLDLLLNPATERVLHQDVPKLMEKLPPPFKSTTVPSLAAIVNLEFAARIASMELSDATLSALKTDLAAIPVSAEAAAARCARYDVGPSDLRGTVQHPALLVFSKSNGFRDNPSVNAAGDALKAIAAR
jgi:hypothetical protein